MTRTSKTRLRTTTTDIPAHLQPGSHVEVSSDDPGYHGSWFAGKIIRPEKPSQFLIQYSTLFETEDSDKLLTEVCDAANLRPAAPREMARKFQLGEKVDAFYNDGWWEGEISEKSRNGRFIVFFQTSSELIEFGENELRLHRNWIDGSWIPPFPEEEKEAINMIKFENGASVEVRCNENGFEGVWFNAKILDSLGDYCLIEYENLRTESGKELLKEVVEAPQIRPPPPPPPPSPEIAVRRYNVSENVDVLHSFGWWEGRILKAVTDTDYMVCLKGTMSEKMFKHSELRLCLGH